MLVLSRRQFERIRIGDDIVVEIADIHGKKVLVGIEAPQHVRVSREEIIDPQPKPSVTNLRRPA